MNLGQFRSIFENMNPDTILSYGFSEPFSWRGIYAEVAFSVVEHPMKVSEIIDNIDKAMSETFYGYKGGEFTYDHYTLVHFEDDESSYSDGEYTCKVLDRIKGRTWADHDAELAHFIKSQQEDDV